MHVDIEPPTHVEPCAMMANRRNTSNRLRGRELLPGPAPRSDFYTFTCNALCGGFGVEKLSWDPSLRAVYTEFNTDEGRSGRLRRTLRLCIYDPLSPWGPRRDKSSWKLVIMNACYLGVPSFSVSSQKISQWFFRCSPCSKNPFTQNMNSFGCPKPSGNHYIQICQLEKDTEMTKVLFFCLQTPQ